VFFAMKYQIPVSRPPTAAASHHFLFQRDCDARQAWRVRREQASLIALVQAAALDYGPHNIRVNRCCRTTDTALVRRVAAWRTFPMPCGSAAAAWAKSHVPGLGRMANPEEIAEFALALASMSIRS